MQIADISEINTETFGDWQRDYLFKVEFETLPKAPRFAELAGDIDPASLDLFIESFPVPESKTDTVRKRRSGQWAIFPTKQGAPGSIRINLNYDEHNRAYRLFHACRQLTGNYQGVSSSYEDGSAVSKPFYVFNLVLMLYKTDKESIGKGYRLKNAWVSEIDDLALDKTKDGLLPLGVTIAYDKRVVIGE